MSLRQAVFPLRKGGDVMRTKDKDLELDQLQREGNLSSVRATAKYWARTTGIVPTKGTCQFGAFRADIMARGVAIYEGDELIEFIPVSL